MAKLIIRMKTAKRRFKKEKRQWKVIKATDEEQANQQPLSEKI